MLCTLTILIVGGVVATNDQHRQQAVDQTPIFVSGQEGYHTYRIPSLIVTGKGTLLAFCEGRKSSSGDSGDIDLLLRDVAAMAAGRGARPRWSGTTAPTPAATPARSSTPGPARPGCCFHTILATIPKRPSSMERARERARSGSPEVTTTAQPGARLSRLPGT